MRFEELRFVCTEAARDLLSTSGRPVPPTVVVPGVASTRLLRLPEFPDDDEARHAYVAQLAVTELVPAEAPAWGFVAEAATGEGADVVVVVYGARRHAPHLTAAVVTGDGDLGEFVPSEELDPTAMPFLHPLQHAVDSVPAVGSDRPGSSPPDPGAGLPLFEPPQDAG